MGTKGGRQPGAGRPKGSRNKVNVELGEAAREYTIRALEQLWKIATHSRSDGARVAALKEILDRGHGKAPQALEHSGLKITHEEALKQIAEKINRARAANGEELLVIEGSAQEVEDESVH